MQRLLPDAFGQALGAILAEQRKEWTRERERIEAEAKALLAETRAELTTLVAELRAENALLRSQVAERLAQVRDGKDGEQGPPGKDADPEFVVGLVDEAIAAAVHALPPPEKGEPGKDADLELVRALVIEEVAKLPPAPAGKDADEDAIVARVLERIPVPKDGDPGDPEVLLPILERMVDDAVAAKPMPEPVPGPKGDPGDPGAAADEDAIVERVLKMIPPPQKGDPGDPGPKGDPGDPGPEADYDLIARMIDDSIKALPTPKDGVGLAGALIDRTGSLILTMTDGRVCELGPVVGKDGEPGTPGKDGLSFDAFELEPEYDGERTVRLKWRDAKGNEQVREWRLPAVLYREVWKPDVQYEAGDAVTWGGSIFIAKADTTEKPGNGATAWKLAVKAGRDGRDGAQGAKGEKGDPGRPGRDLTMLGT